MLDFNSKLLCPFIYSLISVLQFYIIAAVKGFTVLLLSPFTLVVQQQKYVEVTSVKLTPMSRKFHCDSWNSFNRKWL